MSQLIQSGMPCKSCPSSDAMAEYEENFYCFSCKRSWWKDVRSRMITQARFPDRVDPNFPYGTTDELPSEAKALLYKYHFTHDMITQWNIKYHEDCPIFSSRLQNMVGTGPRILLPYIRGGKIQWWEGKALDKNTQIKTINNGGRKEYFITNSGKQTEIVIVEDILSAIRIKEATNIATLALRGTSFGVQKIINAYMDMGIIVGNGGINIYRKPAGPLTFYIWLDGDRPGQRAAKELSRRLTLYGTVYYINSKNDPKCYSADKIVQFIEDSKK